MTSAGETMEPFENPASVTNESFLHPGQQTPGGSVTLRSAEGAVNDEKRHSNFDDGSVVTHEGKNDEKKSTEGPVAGSREEADQHIVTGYKLVLIFIGMLMSIFLVALDQTIVATAIPRIASDFNALEQVTWIASGYFLTQSGLILTYGQVLAVANTKYVYLVAIVLFEVGSLICGVAPNINVLIFGRAFAGCGAAGIFVSALAILARISRIEQRPILFGLFGAVFALSSVIGPLLGGAFTDHVSWRWCFYINLPFGAITIASIIFFIKPEHSTPPADSHLPTWRRLLGIDWVGAALSIGMVTTLLLPLQWGGVTKPWSSASVIAPLCVFAVLVPTFITWQWYKGPKALMPLSLWKRKTQIGCCLEAFFIMLILLCSTYYLPLYYQSAKGKSATSSGISIIAFMMSVVGGAIIAGGIINKTGRPLPFLMFSPFLASIGAGLVFWNLTQGRPSAELYGYQVLMGLGVGGALQNAIIVIQAEYHDEPRMVPQATSLVNFTQLTGGIIGVAVAGTIFGNRLSSSIAKYAPGLSADTVSAVRQSVTVIQTLSGEDKANVIRAYSEALGYVFILAIPAAILGSCSSVLIKNYNLKKLNLEPGMAGAA
ncbi:hypothetical protein FRB97_002243 [Tulasnella sp. 331]|nr:hypothetical protein FRB97_002243 [Tulasnella sp. 331]